MYKSFCSLILLFSFICKLSAQDNLKIMEEEITDSQYEGSFGVILGTDIGGAIPFPFSNIPKTFNAYPQVKPNIGARISFMLIKGWGLGVELTYKNIGMKADARVENQKFRMDEGDMYFTGSAKMDMEFTILELPLYVKYQFKNNKDRILAGIYYSYIITSSFETNPKKGYVGNRPNIADITDMNGIEMDFSPFMDNWDLGFLLGYERRLSSRFNLGLRFSMGFKDIFTPSSNYFDYKMFNMRGSVMISYALMKTKPLFKLNKNKI